MIEFNFDNINEIFAISQSTENSEEYFITLTKPIKLEPKKFKNIESGIIVTCNEIYDRCFVVVDSDINYNILMDTKVISYGSSEIKIELINLSDNRRVLPEGTKIARVYSLIANNKSINEEDLRLKTVFDNGNIRITTRNTDVPNYEITTENDESKLIVKF